MLHEQDNHKRPDEEFIAGEIAFLLSGNKCRLLDGRRTPGYIEAYDEASAMFRFRITQFEDKGKYWELPAEDVSSFQFEKGSVQLDEEDCQRILSQITYFKKTLDIKIDEYEKEKNEAKINQIKEEIIHWLKENSMFFKENHRIDFNHPVGPDTLISDLKHYMHIVGLNAVEDLTATQMVLNPHSGEWIKGMKIILAKMGLVSYNGKIPRKKDLFEGIGSENMRRKYIIHRLAFIRAYFTMLKITEVSLYRGMSSETSWREIKRSFLPCTFNLEVAKAFSEFNNAQFKTVYLLKTMVDIEKLFMTYLETEAMNKQYKEQEAIILYDDFIKF